MASSGLTNHSYNDINCILIILFVIVFSMFAEIGGYSGMLIGFSLLDLANIFKLAFEFIHFRKLV